MRRILVGLIALGALTACTVSPAPTGNVQNPIAETSAAETTGAVKVAMSAQGEALGILTAINAERAKKGLSALSYSTRLQNAAQIHASDMARNGFFAHAGSNGSNSSDRVRASGYKSCVTAENLSTGYPNAQAVVAGWMQSAGHRRNILHSRLRQLGVAIGPNNTVVAVFGAPC